MRHVTVLLAALAMLAAPSAYAELLQSPIANGTYTPLDGATVKGSINVRANGCSSPAAPSYVFALDGVTKNVEYSCPLDFGGDDYMQDTKALADGAHTITMTPEGGGQVLTAKFTVQNGSAPVPPSPPIDPTVTGTATITWKAPTTCADGTSISTCQIIGYDVEQSTTSAIDGFESVSTRSPTQVSYDALNLAPGSYWWRVRTLTLNNVFSDPSAVVSKTISSAPPPPPPTCTSPRPADESRVNQCVAPAVGTWSQSRSYTAAAYPTCWTAFPWSPASAPAGACVTPPPPLKVAPISANVRPVYEPVLSADGTLTVRGTQQGMVASGKTCGAQAFKIGTTIYASVSEADINFDSPTYKGRAHVAICR